MFLPASATLGKLTLAVWRGTMVVRVATVAFEGVEARPVDVQVQISNGTVVFNVVGLGDKAVAESRERVRSALVASGLALPPKRITVNLAPADPNFAIAESNLAFVYAEKKMDLDYALSLAQKARQQMPQLDSLGDTLGWVNYRKGNMVTAKSIFQDCVRSSPQEARYHYHLGMVLASTGDRPRARQELESALRLKLSGPSEHECRQALEQLR